MRLFVHIVGLGTNFSFVGLSVRVGSESARGCWGIGLAVCGVPNLVPNVCNLKWLVSCVIWFSIRCYGWGNKPNWGTRSSESTRTALTI
jgi:hypothetical protein